MHGSSRWLAIAGLGIVLGAGSANAQVILSAGSATGAPGDVVELPITVTGPDAADTAVARFRVAYDTSNAVYDPIYGSGGAVECFVAGDLAGHVTPAPVFFQPDQNRIVVGFGDLQAPVQPFGRAGVIMTCRVAIRPDARNGSFPLFCLGASTASDALGRAIQVSCAPGTLTVTGAASDQGGDVRYGGRPAVVPQVDIPAPAPAGQGAAQPTRAGDSSGGRNTGGGVNQVATPVSARQDAEATPGSGEPGSRGDAGVAAPGGEAGQRQAGMPGPGGATAGSTPATTSTAAAAGTPSAKTTVTAASTPTAKKTATIKQAEEAPPPKEDSGGCQMNPTAGGSGGVWCGLVAMWSLRRRRLV